MILLHEVNHLV